MAKTPDDYDLFVSHSRRLDARIAEALQRGIESFATPWWHSRSLRVFRDASSLSANPDLWGSIETALSRTRYFLLLASPEAANSPWVLKEVQWWIDNRGQGSLYIAVTAGRVPWSETDDGGDEASCLPDGLVGLYTSAPRWVDLRPLRSAKQISRHNPALLDAIADIGAAVRGVAKDQLVGEHIKQHRRVVRTASAAVVLLSLLTVATVIASVLFAGQRNAARQQARIATAKQFSAVARTEANQHIDRAMLFADTGYRMDSAPDTLAAALAVATTSPKLTQIAHAASDMTALAGSTGGGLLVGMRTGSVGRFDLSTRRWMPVMHFSHPVVDVATSQNGRVVLATDGYTVRTAGTGGVDQQLWANAQKSVGAVAVSPDGADLAYTTSTTGDSAGSTITVVSPISGNRTSAPIPDVSYNRLALSKDSVYGFDGGRGNWARLSLADLQLTTSLGPGFGNHNYASAMSTDGSAITYTNSAKDIPIWDTTISHDQSSGGADGWGANVTRWASAPGVNPQALAFSPDNTRLAVADSGTIYVTQPTAAMVTTEPVAQLTGLSGQAISQLVFLGDGSHVAAAAGRTLAVWDLNQVSALTTVQPAQVEAACIACAGAHVVPSPDGTRVAFMTDADPGGIVVHDLRSGHEATYGQPGAFTGHSYGLPSWSPDGGSLLIPRSDDDTVDVVAADTLARTALWPAANPGAQVVISRFVEGGRQFATVTNEGRVTFRDARTGRVLKTTFAAEPADNAGTWRPRMTALDEAGARLAVIDDKGVYSIDLTDGTKQQFPEKSTTSAASDNSGQWTAGTDIATSVSFAGSDLLVAGFTVGGGGWVNNYHGGATLGARHIPLPSNTLEDAVGSDGGGLIAYQASDGALTVLDAATGATLGSFPLNASIEGYKTGLAFTPSGEYLFTVTDSGGNSPGTVDRWALNPAAITETLCRIAGRTLTVDEWKALAGNRTPDLRCR